MVAVKLHPLGQDGSELRSLAAGENLELVQVVRIASRLGHQIGLFCIMPIRITQIGITQSCATVCRKTLIQPVR